MPKPKNVNEYITAAPPKSRPMLRQLRRTITAAAPEAIEKISYGMPYYGYHGRIAYFAAFRNHVSYFVMDAARKKYATEITPWRQTKATLHFTFGSKIPMGLITKLVKEQVRANMAART